ncbi:WbuC family cupin fold metalloprotein [Dechloromonas sp.]|uniref:WbuC family cupin fold metalloprotein n=1 Tax=Dechloromonas sp. TaxID=1917218 RepID=UPI00263F8438|nr:WbuC family cupin fold metalloprotein [Dechloromonas sp.]
MTTLITQSLLAALSEEAAQSPRRRKNLNFHPRDDYPGHRLLNAIEPDSYVVPHRHLDPNKDETIVCLRGRLGVVLFSAENRVVRSIVLTPAGDLCGIDIPHGVFHSVLALEPGTVFFEAKAGPYVPLADDEKAPWAPTEGSPAVAAYLANLTGLFAR